MKEQSHKDEMRNALRGDFERLRARLEDVGSPPAPVAVAPPAPEPAAEAVSEIEDAPHVEPVSEQAVEDAPPVRSSWLARLRDRR